MGFSVCITCDFVEVVKPLKRIGELGTSGFVDDLAGDAGNKFDSQECCTVWCVLWCNGHAEHFFHWWHLRIRISRSLLMRGKITKIIFNDTDRSCKWHTIASSSMPLS